MRRLLVVLGALAAGAILVPADAEAQRRGGGRVGPGFYTIPLGRVGAGNPRVGIGRPGIRGGAIGVRPGIGRVGPGYYTVPLSRYGVRAPRYYGWRYPYYRRGWGYPGYGGYYGWGYPYGGWGLGFGLAAGTVLGAAVASTYPVYTTPAPSPIGGYCATPIRTCALINPAPVGTGCSCRVSGGRARGTVVIAP